MSRQRPEPEEVKLPPLTDLRAVSRDPKRCVTHVYIQTNPWDRERHEWLIFGAAQLRHQKESSPDGRFRLEGRMTSGVTDFEHDSAFVVRLPLIGVQFDGLLIHNHYAFLVGWVDPDGADDFHVPGPGYDPTKHKDAHRCKMKECVKEDPKSHIIVPEGFYVPPFDPELYKLVRGKRVEIRIGPVLPEEDE